MVDLPRTVAIRGSDSNWSPTARSNTGQCYTTTALLTRSASNQDHNKAYWRTCEHLKNEKYVKNMQDVTHKISQSGYHVTRRVRVTILALDKNYITYSSCVSVALDIRREKRMRRIILSSVACPFLQNFSTLHGYWRRSQCPRVLRRRSAAARLLRLWVRIGSVVKCCVLSGRGLCDELITRPEESYRLWCVFVCDLENSWLRRPWPIGRL